MSTTCWYRAARGRAVVPMVPVGTQQCPSGTGYPRYYQAGCHWVSPARRLVRRCRAGAGSWFKANSPVSPVAHHWYYPVVPGGARWYHVVPVLSGGVPLGLAGTAVGPPLAPGVAPAVPCTYRWASPARRLARRRRGLVQTQLPGVANRAVPVFASTVVWYQ